MASFFHRIKQKELPNMDINEFKTVKKLLHKNDTKNQKMKKIVFRLFNQILLTTILFLGTLIVMKVNKDSKTFIYENVYNQNLQFASASELYQKYLGNILPLGSIEKKDTPVFQEKLAYEEDNLYKDGGVLKVGNQYMVPLLESGIIVFMGEKEGYGQTVIVQQVNGIDVWYGNIEATNVKMYDYVEKGEMIGQTLTDQLYLVFQKEGKFLDYKEYIT